MATRELRVGWVRRRGELGQWKAAAGSRRESCQRGAAGERRVAEVQEDGREGSGEVGPCPGEGMGTVAGGADPSSAVGEAVS